MPVTSIHQSCEDRLKQWSRCRDADAGTDAVKGKTTEYLPKLAAQSQPEYDAYLMRAFWYGATGRTVHALTGSIMRIPPKVEAPDALVEQLEDVTLTGMSLPAFTQSIVRELLITGRAGLLLDMPVQSEPGKERPYWVLYNAEQIINWKVEILNGVPTTTMVVLQELYEDEDNDDEFEAKMLVQYRVLKLVNQVYSVEIHRPKRDDRNMVNSNYTMEYEITETYAPNLKGTPINYIPFVFVNTLNMCAETEKPPLLDLVDANFSHFRNAADLEHGRHFTALPTPWITGVSKDTALSIGSSRAWVIPNENAKCGMIEFNGDGLGALERALSSKENLMVVLGARMLEDQKAGVESAEALNLRAQGESSTLGALAQTVGAAMTVMAEWHATWIYLAAKVRSISIKLNTEFHPRRLTSQELSALVSAWQGRGMSWETYYFNLEQGGLTRPGIDAEDEQKLIDAQMPVDESVTFGPDGTPITPQPQPTDDGDGVDGEDQVETDAEAVTDKKKSAKGETPSAKANKRQAK